MGINVMEIFEKEVTNLTQKITATALELEKAPSDRHLLEDLMRFFHTLKGSARAIQFQAILEVAHAMEGLYHNLLDTEGAASSDLVELSLFATDIIKMLMGSDAKEAPPVFAQAIIAYQTGQPLNLSSQTLPTAEESAEFTAVTPNADDSFDINTTRTADAHTLDKLLRLTGELTVAMSAFHQEQSSLRLFADEFNALSRRIELGMGRSTSHGNRTVDSSTFRELSADLAKMQKKFGAQIDSLDHVENRLSVISSSLSTQVTEARLVAMDSVLNGVPRLVRDLARDLDKQCRVEVAGDTTRVDGAVVEAIGVPLLHLVRNALAHGIETPEQRQASNKESEGTIKIEVRKLSTEVRLVVQDDGSGINLEAIRSKAISRGDITESTWENLTQHERLQFIFLPGFSTATQVNEVAGRGFGLDIVKSAIEEMGGRIEVETTANLGTRFVLYAPLSLSLMNSILVNGGTHPFFGTQWFCFPSNEILQIARVGLQDLRTIDGQEAIRVGDETLKVFAFHQIMGLAPVTQDISQKHLLIVGSDRSRYGLLVEGVEGVKEVVSRQVATQIDQLQHVSGATILVNGAVALIVDVKDIVQQLVHERNTQSLHTSRQTDASGERAKGSILVVEDSVTVREVERHVLESAGYDVVTAVDGKDGLNQVKRSHFDLIITDIDMPRMDGIEMIATLRRQEKFSTVPIVVVSYKDRDEDRAKAMDAGASYYVTKSEFDSGEMLNLISDLLRNLG